MRYFTIVLLCAALTALGNFAGGLRAEVIYVSQKTLSVALPAAARIILAVVGVELMPAALQAQPTWVPVPAFVAGDGFFVLLDQFIDVVQSRFLGAACAPCIALFRLSTVDC